MPASSQTQHLLRAPAVLGATLLSPGLGHGSLPCREPGKAEPGSRGGSSSPGPRQPQPHSKRRYPRGGTHPRPAYTPFPNIRALPPPGEAWAAHSARPGISGEPRWRGEVGRNPSRVPAGKGSVRPSQGNRRSALLLLTCPPATWGGGGRCRNYLGKGTGPRSLGVGQGWRGYVKEVGEKGSGTVGCAHPGARAAARGS